MFETMLIVDDVDMERELFKELMQDTFTVLEASNGIECLEVVESCRENIDVILLDLMMPELDGFGVLEKRLEQDYFKDIPVIVLTASGAVEDQVKAFEFGASDFISKPIIPEIAISRVNNVLMSKRRVLSILKDTEELKVKSEMDQMTGLYNKVTAEKLIDEILQNDVTKEHALMIIDIDNFKAVNDTEGHQAGDHTIRIIADLLSSHFRESDVVGRIGGDEFVVCMHGLSAKQIARQKADDIVRIMKYKPNLSLPANVSLSIGLAFSERQLTDYRALAHKADQALYASKQAGKARATEYGKEKDAHKIDDRAFVVLCSRERSICSVVQSVLNEGIHFVSVVNLDGVEAVQPKEAEKLKLLMIDVSDQSDAGEVIWENYAKIDGICDVPVLTICQEGNLTQYKKALTIEQVVDVITTPLDVEQLQRRITKLIS